MNLNFRKRIYNVSSSGSYMYQVYFYNLEQLTHKAYRSRLEKILSLNVTHIF